MIDNTFHLSFYEGEDFADVPPGSTFYIPISALRWHGIVTGYPDNTFRPNIPVTRGQLIKMIVSSAIVSSLPHWALLDPETNTFEDVPVGSVYFRYVETAAFHQLIAGYPCGGPGEPCGPDNKPYFRINTPATRAQTSKILFLVRIFPGDKQSK